MSISGEGPGTVSMFGGQILSTRTSEPRPIFGTSGRIEKINEKAFHFKQLSTASPGFVTSVSSGFGSQPDSRCRTYPSYVMGIRHASDVDTRKESRPGPGEYSVRSTSLGRQPLSVHVSCPEFRQSTGGRFAQHRLVFKDDFQTPAAQSWTPTAGWLGDAPGYTFHGKSNRSDIAQGLPAQRPTGTHGPGPGTYDASSSLGTQTASRCPTHPRAKIGHATRSSAERLFISREHEKDGAGKASPGPSAYSPPAKGSRVRAPPSWSFGSSDRFSQLSEKANKKSNGVSNGVPNGMSYATTYSWMRTGGGNPGPGSYAV